MSKFIQKMKRKKLYNYLMDNGFGFLFVIFILLSLYFLIRAEWCVSQIKEAWNFSVIHGFFVGFGFTMPFISLGILTYITQKEYDRY